MKKQSNAIQKPSLSPILDENEEQQKPWAITQQHGQQQQETKQSRRQRAVRNEARVKGAGGGDSGNKPERTTLPVLGK